MIEERELLQRCLDEFDYKGVACNELCIDIHKLLAQPEQEPFKPDWVNYRQGVEDAKREPLSEDVIWDNMPENPMECSALAFIRGVKFAEKAHGIGE